MSGNDENDAARKFREGAEALANEDWDYLIEALQKAMRSDPENPLFRETLRGVEARKKLQQKDQG